MQTNLLHRLAFGAWAIEPNRAVGFFPLVTNILRGEAVVANNERPTLAASVMMASEDGGLVPMEDQRLDTTTTGRVAVVPIQDVIMKHTTMCGPIGMADVAQLVQDLDNDPRISGIVLDIDSPGGEATGMMLLVDQLRKTRKPVVSIVRSGMAASAAYGIAASTRKVFASQAIDEFGSIGTYVTLADWKAYYEKEGLKLHDVYATDSTEKNKPFLMALDGDYEKLRTEWLDPFNRAFQQLVKEGRPDLKDDGKALKGKLYFADEAIAVGLVDGYADLNGAIGAVRQLAREQSNENPKTEVMFGSKLKATLALVEAKAEERTEELLTAAQQELDAISEGVILVPATEEVKNLDQLNTLITGLKKAAKEATASVEKLTTDLKEATDKLATAQLELKTAQDRLLEQDGGTAPRTKADPKAAGEALSEQELLDSLPHNQEADRILGDATTKTTPQPEN